RPRTIAGFIASTDLGSNAFICSAGVIALTSSRAAARVSGEGACACDGVATISAAPNPTTILKKRMNGPPEAAFFLASSGTAGTTKPAKVLGPTCLSHAPATAHNASNALREINTRAAEMRLIRKVAWREPMSEKIYDVPSDWTKRSYVDDTKYRALY